MHRAVAGEAEKDVILGGIVLRVLVYVVQVYGHVAVLCRASFAFATNALPSIPCRIAVLIDETLPLVLRILSTSLWRSSQVRFFSHVPSVSIIGERAVIGAVKGRSKHSRSAAFNANAVMLSEFAPSHDAYSLERHAASTQRSSNNDRLFASRAFTARFPNDRARGVLMAPNLSRDSGGILDRLKKLKNSFLINLRHLGFSYLPSLLHYMYNIKPVPVEMTRMSLV